jgi:hypothetical protein
MDRTQMSPQPPSQISSSPPQLIPQVSPLVPTQSTSQQHKQKPGYTSAAEGVQKALDAKEQIGKLFNPSPFRERAHSVLPERPHIQKLWEKLHFHRVPYCEVWPDGATEEMVDIARANGTPIHTTVHIVISIPKTVYETTQVIRLKPSLDFPGGGGVSSSFFSHGRMLTLTVYGLRTVRAMGVLA